MPSSPPALQFSRLEHRNYVAGVSRLGGGSGGWGGGGGSYVTFASLQSSKFQTHFGHTLQSKGLPQPPLGSKLLFHVTFTKLKGTEMASIQKDPLIHASHQRSLNNPLCSGNAAFLRRGPADPRVHTV